MSAALAQHSIHETVSEWISASIEVLRERASEAYETTKDFTRNTYEMGEKFLVRLKTRQIQEHEAGEDNLRVARGGKPISYHLQPLRPQPVSMMGRLMNMFTRGSTPAPE